MVIDSHVHFWKRERADPVDCHRRFEGIDRDFLPDDLRTVACPLGVTGAIAVQAAAAVEETDFLLGLAERDDFIKGVVGWVDLESDTVADVLDRLCACPHFVGVRVMAAPISRPGLLEKPKIRRGIGEVAKRGLVLDLWIRPQQLAECRLLFREVPDLVAVINHCGRPLVMAREWRPWADLMAEVAAKYGRVSCKLSGLIERSGFDWTVRDVRPYVRHVLETFGPSRTLFASNWPMINLVGRYALWWEALNDILAELGLDKDEKDSIFFGAVTRAYGLSISKTHTPVLLDRLVK